MSTTKKVEAGSMLAVAALVLILIAVGAFRISASDSTNDASERLTQQAEQVREEARAARAADAWSQRLNGLAATEGKAPAPAAAGMSDRAIDALADRLTGLADYYASQK